jgi:hypothetical protein
MQQSAGHIDQLEVAATEKELIESGNARRLFRL